ncbi:ATP-binding cassette domain-containing protein [Romboutsia sp.]|uniref:ATP-binding cassette domain-containing protein n=1 Tax=Romboutsia sp. TaxID=1965302 RepID=UPI003F3FFBE0
MITIKKLVKNIKNQQPLKIDNLEIEDGHIYSILGHNGCGKSTLVKILYNINEFDEGSININNEGFSETIVHKYISYNPQRCHFLLGTLKDNFEYLYKYSKNENLLSKNRLNELLVEFNLEHKLQTNIKKLSGGEQAKAQFIRTLIMNKDIYIYDEPTANMDFTTTKKVENKLSQLKDDKKTVLLITHDFMQAKRLSDYIIFMDNLNLVGKFKTNDFFNNGFIKDTL